MTTSTQGVAGQNVQEAVTGLREQALALKGQLDAMAASRKDLVGRIQTSSNPEAVARLQEVLAHQDGSAAELHARLAEINARIAELEAAPQLVPQIPQILLPSEPPPRSGFPISDDAITGVFVMFSIALIIPLSVALTRRVWRRPQPAAPAAENVSSSRLDRLEQAVDAIAIEVERVAESQRFVAKILAERPSTSRAASAESGDASVLKEGAPFLALGAGPIEPIRVPERQAVKPSITPH